VDNGHFVHGSFILYKYKAGLGKLSRWVNQVLTVFIDKDDLFSMKNLEKAKNAM
jgi:hypothetical protein